MKTGKFYIMALIGVAGLGFACQPDKSLKGEAGDLIESGKIWYLYGMQDFFSDGHTDTVWNYCKCSVEKDTVFLGERWNFVRADIARKYGDEMDMSEKEMLRRQEGTSVYEYDAYEGERRLFEFAVQEGDAVESAQGKLTVREVFDTLLPGGDGKMRRAIRVDEDVWVEDIGSLRDGILQAFFVDGAPQWHLIGCKKDGVWYYKHPDFEAFVGEEQKGAGGSN